MTACMHHPPRYADGPGTTTARDAFLSAYDSAWKSVPGRSSDGIDTLEMVHPGIPDDKGKVRLWYLLRQNATPDGGWRLDVVKENAVVDHAGSAKVSIRPGPTHPVHRTGYIDVSDLEPDSVYRLELSGGGLSRTHSVTIRTPPTDPSRASGTFSFLVSSCFLPWATEPGGLTLREETRNVMSSLLNRATAPIEHRPAFHLKLGDQIYTDGGADGDRQESRAAYLRGSFSDAVQSAEDQVDHVLNRLYRYNFGLPAIDASMTGIPTAMMIDDHEVRDGWGSYRVEDEAPWREFYGRGLDAFQAFQASRNPGGGKGIARPFDLYREEDSFHFSFKWGPATRFFVLDTRSRAGCVDPKYDRRDAVCAQQLAQFRGWIEDAAKNSGPTLLVVALAVPLTLFESDSGRLSARTAFSALADDAADRLTDAERIRLLTLLADHLKVHPAHRLLILSGDVHYSGITTLRLGDGSGDVRGYEIISSGLAQQGFKRANSFVSSELVGRMPFVVTTHGVHAVPSFAEIFVSPGRDPSAAPEVKVLFYPSARLRGPRWSGFFDGAELKPFVLKFPSDQGELRSMALRPERYPRSKKNRLGNLTSNLECKLDEIWELDTECRCAP